MVKSFRSIELFRQRQDVAETLGRAGLYISSIVANQLEMVAGRFTGRIADPIITKRSKPGGIPEGSIFIGDDHDERAVIKLRDRNFEFINCERAKLGH